MRSKGHYDFIYLTRSKRHNELSKKINYNAMMNFITLFSYLLYELVL